MTCTVKAACGTEKDGFETRAEAQEGADTHEALCEQCDPDSAEIIQNGGQDTEVVEPAMTEDGKAEKNAATHPDEFDLPDEQPSVEDDPVDWMPSHFVDTIQGVPTVNRKGYAVIASQYGVAVTAEPITLASKTDFEYAEFRAVAQTEDGREYSGIGSAHVDRQDGDDKHLLNELAETRAMKRAVAWATGVGMTAVEEMKGEL